MKAINLKLAGGTFEINLTGDGGAGISSNLHYSYEQWCDEFEDEFEDASECNDAHERYEGAIDGVESMLLAMASTPVFSVYLKAISVEKNAAWTPAAEQLKEVIETTLNGIGNNL